MILIYKNQAYTTELNKINCSVAELKSYAQSHSYNCIFLSGLNLEEAYENYLLKNL